MKPGIRIAVNVDLYLFFSTALLSDYQAYPHAPSEANINGFLDALAQPGGPVEAAFNYLHENRRRLPAYVRERVV